jgi:hypothetical protein
MQRWWACSRTRVCGPVRPSRCNGAPSSTTAAATPRATSGLRGSSSRRRSRSAPGSRSSSRRWPKTRRATPRRRPTRFLRTRLRRQRGRLPPATELAPPSLDSGARVGRPPVLPPVRPPPHLGDVLLYEGRTVNEVAEHLGHADPASRPGPTRTSCATPQSAAASRSPAQSGWPVDPARPLRPPKPGIATADPDGKPLEIEREPTRADSNRGPSLITSLPRIFGTHSSVCRGVRSGAALLARGVPVELHAPPAMCSTGVPRDRPYRIQLGPK